MQSNDNTTFRNKTLLSRPIVYKTDDKLRNYERFAKFIKEYYPNAKNILEVGAGMGYLSVELKKLGYNVTAMDNFNSYTILMFKKYNIDFSCKYFTVDTNIDMYDLVIGLHCCNATELVLRNCSKNNKDCAVVLCEINEGLENNNILTRQDYINYLKSINERIKLIKLDMYQEFGHDFKGETLYLKK